MMTKDVLYHVLTTEVSDRDVSMARLKRGAAAFHASFSVWLIGVSRVVGCDVD